MRFSKSRITVGVSAALILCLPTYLYADQHSGAPAAEQLGVLLDPNHVHRTHPFKVTRRHVEAVREEGENLHQDGTMTLVHQNGTNFDVEFHLHHMNGKGLGDIAVDTIEHGMKVTHTVNGETGIASISSNGRIFELKVKPDGNLEFEGKEYAPTDRALVEHLKKSGALAQVSPAHFACAYEELVEWASHTTSKASPANVPRKVTPVVKQVLPIVMNGWGAISTFTSMF